MRKLARKLGFGWVIVGFCPLAVIAHLIGYIIGLSDLFIVCVQIPLLIIQLFGIFMQHKYWAEVYGFN